MAAPGQLGQKVCKTPSMEKYLGMVVHVCHPSDSEKQKKKKK
jgi:hypothetical protein